MTTDGPPAAQNPAGLRERKKLATRQALSWAALRLAQERGLEHVRIEDIAAEAGVSPRTFNNYFANKYEAIVSRHVDRVRQSAGALRERPAAEPLWDAVRHVALAPFATADSSPDPQWTAGVRLLLAEPALQGELMKAGADANRAFAAAVAERTGTDADRDVYPNLVAAAVLAAQQVASDRWLHTEPPVALLPLVREALDLLLAGLPDPTGG
ncbi:TetR/AcrR family transcriptional regulator [Kitasatospora sp. NPDC057223]|uniref:TetR/AcrR family transcriptional regulator n=1 Tax=Kitasatospora sp. NPDC057223 TaxID=3346055 RepID=UPI0036442ECD